MKSRRRESPLLEHQQRRLDDQRQNRREAFGYQSLQQQRLLVRRAEPCVIHKLPTELLITVLTTVIDLYGSPSIVQDLALVCRRWDETLSSRFVWDRIAKKHFVALPLLRLVRSPTPTSAATSSAPPKASTRKAIAKGKSPSPSASASRHNLVGTPTDVEKSSIRAFFSSVWQSLKEVNGKAMNDDDGLMTVAKRTTGEETGEGEASATPPPPSSSPLRQRFFYARRFENETQMPSRNEVQCQRREVTNYLSSIRYRNRVIEHRRYVLHTFVSSTLLAFFLAVLCFVCGAEGFGPEDALTVENGFRCLFLTYIGVVTTVVTNIVMQAHFEPKNLWRRILDHKELIMFSTGALFASVTTVLLPLYFTYSNMFRLPTTPRWQWSTCVSPIIAAFFLWQLEVLHSNRRSIAAVCNGTNPFSLTLLYYGMANLTPTLFAGAVYSLATYAEYGGPHMLLIIFAVPLLLVFATLAGVFFLDFALRQDANDGIAGVCLSLASLFPIALMIWEPRGLTGLPLVAAVGGFFVLHLQHMVRLFRTVDEADAWAEVE